MTDALRRIYTRHSDYPRDLSLALQPGRAIYDPDYALNQDPDAYETILRDPETAHAIEYRKHLAAGRRWIVTPASEAEADQQAAGVVEELIGGISRFGMARFRLADAVFMGSTYAFIAGDREPGQVAGLDVQDWWRPRTLADVDKRRFRQVVDSEGQLRWMLWSPRRSAWESLGKRAAWFIKAVYDDREQTMRFGRGLIESIYHWQYSKTRVLEEGLQGLERWAQGVVTAKIDALAEGSADRTSDDAAQAWLDAIENMRSRHVLVHDSRDELTLVESSGQGHQMVTEFLAYLAGGIRTLVLGANLPTAATEGGSFALAQIQENSTEALIQFDRAILGEAITDDLVGLVWSLNRRQLAAVGLGEAKMPGFKLIDEQREDPTAAVAVIGALLDRGVPLRVDEVYDRVGMTPPGPADAVLEATPAAAPLSEEAR